MVLVPHLYMSAGRTRRTFDVPAFQYAVSAGRRFSFKEQTSFNSMAVVTICSDLGSQKIQSLTDSTVTPSIRYEVMGPDAMILVF